MNFPFQDGDVPRLTSYGVYISQLIRFAPVSSHCNIFVSLIIAYLLTLATLVTLRLYVLLSLLLSSYRWVNH